MADKHADAHAVSPPVTGGSLDDRELDLRSIVIFGVVLFGGTLVVLLLMWGMSAAFKSMEEAKDRPPSPLGEARLDPIPPGPRLQAVPPRDMDELRAANRQALTTYGWVDQPNGVAHIPVDRAIAILTEKGLPPTPAVPAPPSAAPEEAAASAAPASSAPATKPPKHHKKEKETVK
jgi:hypothetical protein